MNRIYGSLLLEALRDISSYDSQKISWFKNDQGLCSSLTEEYHTVFDDTGLAYALDNSPEVFGKNADKVLSELKVLIEFFDYSTMSEQEILNSPEMQVVREKAATALKLIQESKAEGVTVEFVEVGQPL